MQPVERSAVLSCCQRSSACQGQARQLGLSICSASRADLVFVWCLQQSVAQVGTILPPLSPTYQPMYVEGSMQLSQVRIILHTYWYSSVCLTTPSA